MAEETDVALLPNFLNTYFDDVKERMERVTNSIETKDTQTLEDECHTIGSSSAMFGAMEFHQVSRTIENLCQDGKHDQAFAEVTNLIDAQQAAFKALQNFLTDHAN